MDVFPLSCASSRDRVLGALVVWRRYVMEHRHICLFFIIFFSFVLVLKKKKKKYVYIDEGTFWLLLLMFQTLRDIDERSSPPPLQLEKPLKKKITPLSEKNLERACQISNISEVSQVYEGRLYSLCEGQQGLHSFRIRKKITIFLLRR